MAACGPAVLLTPSLTSCQMAQFAAATQRSAFGPAKLAAAFAAVLLLCLAALQLQVRDGS